MIIIIVEDESIIRIHLKEIIINLGYFVIDMQDQGDKAIKSILNLNPEVIFLDINLKGKVTGIEVAKIIKKKTPSIKIILLTAYPIETLDLKGISYDDFIDKPFNKYKIKKVLSKFE